MSSGWDDYIAEKESGWDQVAVHHSDVSDASMENTEIAPAAPPASAGVALAVGSPKAQVPEEVLQALRVPQPLMQCPLAPHLEYVMGQVPFQELVCDPSKGCGAFKSLADFFMGPDVKLHSSKKVVCDHASVSHKQLDEYMALLTSCTLQLDRQSRARVEEALVSSAVELLMYLDLSRYDETPLKIAHDHSQQGPSTSSGSALPSSWPQGNASEVPGPSSSGRTTSVAKILSSQHKAVFVFKVFSADGLQDEDEVVALIYNSLSWNQILGSASGACLARALLESTGVTPHSKEFILKIRACSSDAAPSNLLAEKFVLASRDPEWVPLHLTCNVHKISRSMTRTFQILDQDISGLIHFALSLQVGASMTLFRESLAAVIAARPLLIQRGAPPSDVVEYQSFVLEVFGLTGTRVAERHFLLSNLCSGDWRKPHILEIYVPAAVEVDEEVVRQKLLEALMFVFTHRAFATYPRHRWLGCDSATDQVALAVFVHRLGADAFQVMNTAMQTKQHPAAVARALVDRASGDSVPFRPQRKPASSHDDTQLNEEVTADAQAEQETGEREDSTPAAGPHGGWEAFAAKNAQSRRKAQDWLTSKPEANLLTLRLLMQPLVRLLQQYIGSSGAAEEQRRARAVAVALLEGDTDVAGRGPIEDYIGLLAEQQFYDDLQQALESSGWKWIPPEAQHLKQQSIAFRISSRIGCLVHQLLVLPTKSPPLLTFQLLHDEKFANTLLELPQCLQDDFTKKFLGRFGSRLTSKEAISCLSVISAMTPTETVQVEWGHGRFHRLVTAGSSQTHVPHVRYINGQWVLQKHAQNMSRAHLRKTSSVRTKVLKRPAASLRPQSTKAKKGGGAFRAFISLVTRGRLGPIDFSAMGERYREEREQNTQLYQEAVRRGREGTRRKREGSTTFGPNLKILRRSRARALARASSRPEGSRLLSVTAKPLTEDNSKVIAVLSHDVQGSLSRVRAMAKAKARAKKDHRRSQLSVLQVFEDRFAKPRVDALLQRVPELNAWHTSLLPQPSGIHQVFELLKDHQPEAMALASLTHSQAHSNNLAHTLKDDWAFKNRVIEEPLASDLPLPPPKPRSKCYDAGFCFCTPRGRAVGQFRAALLQSLKVLCPRSHQANRRLLQEGFVIFSLQAPDRVLEEPTAWDTSDDEPATDPEQKYTMTGKRWYHIGLQYLKPYRPTLQELLVESEEPSGRIWLRQSGKYHGDLEALDQLSMEVSWQLQFWKLLSTTMPLAVVDPKLALVEQLSQAEQVWPRRRRRQAKPRSLRHSAGQEQEEMALRQPVSMVGRGEVPGGEQPDAEGSEHSDSDAAAASEGEASSEEDGGPQSQEVCLEEELLRLHLELTAVGVDEGAVGRQDNSAPEVVHGPCHVHEEGVRDMGDPLLDDLGPLAYVPGEPASSGAAAQPDTQAADAKVAPQVAAPKAAPAVILRERADVSLDLACGKLTYYRQGFFTCHCNHPGHIRCVMTRSATSTRSSTRGRPLGFLLAWLKKGEDCPDKASHRLAENWPTLSERQAARTELMQTQTGLSLLGCERVPTEDEPEEPDLV